MLQLSEDKYQQLARIQKADVLYLLENTNKHLKKWFYKKTGYYYDELIADYYLNLRFRPRFNGRIEKAFQRIKKQFQHLDTKVMYCNDVDRYLEDIESYERLIGHYPTAEDFKACIRPLDELTKLQEAQMETFLFLFNIFGIRMICNGDYLDSMQGHLTEQVLNIMRVLRYQKSEKVFNFLLFFDYSLCVFNEKYSSIRGQSYKCNITYVGRQQYFLENGDWDGTTKYVSYKDIWGRYEKKIYDYGGEPIYII